MVKLEQHKDARPPVVAILGHIDHGKSTLIDYIRKTNVAETEVGGITQHISAYEIIRTSKDKKKVHITFLDTPGHEAFERIRIRCASLADIAALIISAEDGVKPQTLEAFKHIKECSMPYLVVITKIDKPSANVERTKQGMAENGIYVEGYGGDTPVVELSAITGKGVSDFLDMISLMAELDGKTADRNALGSGVIVESYLDAKRGITAVGIIRDGTVRQGLFAAAPGAVTPIRFFLDGDGNSVDELSFSSPIQIIGWDKMPKIGTEFKTFLKKEEAVNFAAKMKTQSSGGKPNQKAVDGLSFLPIVVKADTTGSLEVITDELKKLSRERILPKVISSSVGSINENNVKSALTTPGTVIIGFNTKIDPQAAALAERSGITTLLFNIIYELTDKVKELLSEKEPRIEVEEMLGTSKVLKLFGATKGKQIIGGRVLSGLIKRGASIKIMRRDTEIGQGKIKELQQSKIAVDSLNEGSEFGAMIESKVEIVPGDMFNMTTLVTK